MSISYDVNAEQSSPFYGRLVVTNIHPKGTTPVKVKEYFYIKFTSPAHIGNSDLNGVTHPWVDITPDIDNQQIGSSSLYRVTAKIHFHSPYTFNGTETFTFYVNGDLGSDPAHKQFTKTFTLATD